MKRIKKDSSLHYIHKHYVVRVALSESDTLICSWLGVFHTFQMVEGRVVLIVTGLMKLGINKINVVCSIKSFVVSYIAYFMHSIFHGNEKNTKKNLCTV